MQRLDHPLGDDLARPGHPLGRATQRGRRHGRARSLSRRARQGLLRRLSHLGPEWPAEPGPGSGLGALSGLRRLRGALGAPGFDHVLLANAPADPGAGDGLQVHRVLGGELADQRGDVRCLSGAGQRRGRRVLLGLALFGSGR